MKLLLIAFAFTILLAQNTQAETTEAYEFNVDPTVFENIQYLRSPSCAVNCGNASDKCLGSCSEGDYYAVVACKNRCHSTRSICLKCCTN